MVVCYFVSSLFPNRMICYVTDIFRLFEPKIMAKGSRKRVARYGNDQSGCMWGLINIFDFRLGRPSQRLLSDKKRGSKRISGEIFSLCGPAICLIWLMTDLSKFQA